MPCAAPIPAYLPAAGGPLKFKQPRDGRAYIPIEVPCGTCILCREEAARQWGVRITHEASQWTENSFVTLTYEDKHLPEHSSLDYSHLQKFWKRLRKNYGQMRYYAVGEYGDKNNRPHYHACVFGHAFTEDRIILKETPNRLWTCPELEALWGLGNVSVGTLNFQTASYTASYVTKKLNSKQQYVRVDEKTGELIALVQPRAFMSRNIALTWLQKFGTQIYNRDYVVIDGSKQKPPKFYDRWYAESDPDWIVAPNGDTWRAEKKREQKMKQIKEERKQEGKKTKPEQHRARARNAHARAKHRKKSL